MNSGYQVPRFSWALAFLIGPGLSLLVSRGLPVNRLIKVVLTSLERRSSSEAPVFYRTLEGQVIPRPILSAVRLGVAQLFFVVLSALLVVLNIGNQTPPLLTAFNFTAPILCSIVLFSIQYRIVFRNRNSIDKAMSAIFSSGEWVATADVLPQAILDLRMTQSNDRARLGVSIENVSPEQISAAMQRVEQHAKAANLSFSEYCETAFHRRNELDPEECDYSQGESLAKTFSNS